MTGKDNIISLRMSPAEYSALKAYAEKDGRTISDVIRRAIKGAIA